MPAPSLSVAQVAYLRKVKAAEPNSLAAKTRGAPAGHGLYVEGYIAITNEPEIPGAFHVLTPRGRAHLETLDRVAAFNATAVAAGKVA